MLWTFVRKGIVQLLATSSSRRFKKVSGQFSFYYFVQSYAKQHHSHYENLQTRGYSSCFSWYPHSRNPSIGWHFHQFFSYATVTVVSVPFLRRTGDYSPYHRLEDTSR